MPGPPAIIASGVVRVFRTGVRRKRQVALAGLDLEVKGGATTGLVGPNGSGKSTLLRLFAGVDRPTAGSVRVLGGAPDSEAARRRVSFLPDGSPFPGELVPMAALQLISSLKGLRGPGARDACREMLERVDLTRALDTPLRGFSRGMHRRFGLAQAFIGRPDVILLDEPSAGLDAPGFPVLADLIQEARSRGATIVLASHVASDLVEHCERLALLQEGRLVCDGTPDELLGEPGSLTLDVRGIERADDPALGAELRDALARLGATNVELRPTRRSLVELYRSNPGGEGRP